MSDLLQLPIINSPPVPQTNRLASTAPEPEGSAFKDVLQSQMDTAKSVANGKAEVASEKTAPDEAVSRPSDQTLQESETDTENPTQPEITPTMIDPAFLGIAPMVQAVPMDPPQATSELNKTGVDSLSGNNITNPFLVSSNQNAGNTARTMGTIETRRQDDKAGATTQQVTVAQANSEMGKPIQPTATGTEALDHIDPAPVATATEPAKNEGKPEPVSAELPKADARPVNTSEVAKTTQPLAEAVANRPSISTHEVENPNRIENLKVAEPLQDQAPPGESPCQVEIRPSGLETSPTQSMEPARLAEAQNTDMLGQITRQMDGLIQSGRNSIRIQLNPQDLGQIELKITSTHQGVGVTMIAENHATGKLLENQMNQLRQSLTDAGIQIANLHIGTQSNPQSFQGSAQPQPYKGPSYTGKENITNQMETERVVYNTTSLIDYKI
jgi:hypothetical protein